MGVLILSPFALVQIIVKQVYLFTPPTAVISINDGKLVINCNEVIIANRTSNNGVHTHCHSHQRVRMESSTRFTIIVILIVKLCHLSRQTDILKSTQRNPHQGLRQV